MKPLIFTLLLIGCAQPKSSTTRVQWKFLIAGQSNSVSPAQGDLTSYYSKTGNVMINRFYENRFEFIRPTRENPVSGGVTWLCLGDMLSIESKFNIVGRGNTSTNDWVNTLIPRLIDALSAERYDAVLWVQGESDLGSTDETFQNMKMIIEASKAAQDIPWFVALNGQLKERTRLAQEQIINLGYAKRGADLDKIRMEHPEYWDTGLGEIERLAGHEMHAQLWFEALSRELLWK